ncbi:hypothetical protein [Microcoleus sp. herbarium14]|uniref:hypothetical protein n=1 Tax=Microcoleus sp. herbarium14 TaxID=3055439 RepID=UPI002FD703BB
MYLDPAVEQALIAFCEQKGMVSKNGFMYSAGVNAVLAEFFGVSSVEISNTLPHSDNILATSDNIPAVSGNIPIASNIPTVTGNIPVEHTQVEGLPGKFKA